MKPHFNSRTIQKMVDKLCQVSHMMPTNDHFKQRRVVQNISMINRYLGEMIYALEELGEWYGKGFFESEIYLQSIKQEEKE